MERLATSEILHLFETYQFGRTPQPPYAVRFETVSKDAGALNGTAIRKQIVIHFSANANGPKATLLLYIPSRARRSCSGFLGLNFGGNHAVTADPGNPPRRNLVARACETDRR